MKVRGRPTRSIAVLVALVMLIAGMSIVPAFAAGSFEGGVFDAPKYVPNDHTPVAVRISAPAGALAASTDYYLKMRFTVASTPSSSTNRGYTWNPDTDSWVQERDSWLDFPVVTTAADGSLDNTWVYVKFGNEMNSGDYYLLTSLSSTGDASTFNSIDPVSVTVVDMASEGLWVHNGTATSYSNKRAELLSHDPTQTVYALSQTELNGVDDETDMLVDDEDYGPVGQVGDYRLGILNGLWFDVYLNRVLQTNYSIDSTDTDIALGATDMIAPTAPAGVEAVPGSGSVELTWDPSTDADSGVDHYVVYRWIDDPLTTAFTPLKATVGWPDGTTFVDTDVENGVEYSYLVRAVDADTNVSARSATVKATPAAENETDRIAGATRYKTAIEISAANFAGSSVTTAVIATGKNFPDALSASGLAGVYGSPVLLVGDSVDASLTAELDRLGATGVVLIGGDNAISPAVEAALDADYDIERIAGLSRYETAAKVARKVDELAGPLGGAFIVRGDSFPDALATSPFAYSNQWPVLLVQTNAIPAETSSAISDLDIENAVVAGGELAITPAVVDQLDGMMTGLVERVNGDSRYATAAAIAEYGYAAGWGDFAYVGLATGINFPDALGGGVAAGANGGVLLLTPATVLDDATETSIVDHKIEIDLVEVFGGINAIADSVIAEIEAIFAE